MSTGKTYDYIIAGAGCAGLSLALHLAESGQFSNKKILLLDKDSKQKNDRTWCFWEEGEGLAESIVYHRWKELNFEGHDFKGRLNIAPYTYKMIRGLDYYNYCLERISHHSNFELGIGVIEDIFSNEKETGVVFNGQRIMAEYVFNSAFVAKPSLKKNQYWLLQHFKGWFIETEKDEFDADTATLMDFNISQEFGTAFCYVLPFTSRRALVEYTLFTPSLLAGEQYDEGLRSYITGKLKVENYRVLEEETGVIPMTNYRFPARHHHIINLGTAGGQTKGSSGYTFQFIQKHSRALVAALQQYGKPDVIPMPGRFHFYDSVLLNILHNNTLPGKDIFTKLFAKNKASSVLRFLDNESAMEDELKIISTLPTFPFMKAAMKQLF